MSVFGGLEGIAADLYPYRWPITIGLGVAVLAAVWFAVQRGWHLAVWRHKIASGIALVAIVAAAVPAVDYFVSPLWERSFLEEASPLAAVSIPNDSIGEAALDGEDESEATTGEPAEDMASPGDPTAGPALDGSREPAATNGEPQDEVSSPDDSVAEPASDQSPEPEDTQGESPPDGANDSDTAPSEPAQPAFEPRVTHRGEVTGADDFHFGSGEALLIETAPDTYTFRFEDFSVRNGPDLYVYLTPEKDSVDGALDLGSLRATDGSFNYEVPAGTDISQYRYAIVWCRPFSVLFASAPLDGVS